MSHYDIKFTGSKADKEHHALKECVAYLGKDRFNRMVQDNAKALRGASCKEAYRALRFTLPFAGIQGYWPTRAYFKHLWPLV
jgi:hypothetical protein